MNRKMTNSQALSLVRKHARVHGLKVEALPKRGKGSHQIYQLVDPSGAEVERFGLTGHRSKDMSWTMLQRLEQRLAPIFGDNWTEKR